MVTSLFDQEKIMEIYDYHIAKAAYAEGFAEGILLSIKNLMETLGFPVEAAMNALGVPEDEQPKYTEMLRQ